MSPDWGSGGAMGRLGAASDVGGVLSAGAAHLWSAERAIDGGHAVEG